MNKKFTVSHRGLPRVFLYQRCQTTLCLRSNFLSTLQKYEDFLNPQWLFFVVLQWLLQSACGCCKSCCITLF